MCPFVSIEFLLCYFRFYDDIRYQANVELLRKPVRMAVCVYTVDHDEHVHLAADVCGAHNNGSASPLNYGHHVAHARLVHPEIIV